VQKISPFLWFNSEAEEAAGLYTSTFPDSRILSLRRYGEAGPGPKGQVMTLSLQLLGQSFMALNGGPEFSFTPAVSFFVTFPTAQEVDAAWSRLSEKGNVYMELAEYPFSKRFGWVGDRFGVSWQLSVADGPRTISPYALFVGAQCGMAEEAMKLWTSLFEGSSIGTIMRSGPGEEMPAGYVRVGWFTLAGQPFMAADSGAAHAFSFTPAISFFIDCRSQEEIDRLWSALSDGGQVEQCGWVRDRFGISWQVVPTVLGGLLDDPDPARSSRVMNAMLGMKKLDIRALEEAGR